MQQAAQRVIYWNVPPSFKVVMYVLFFAALGIFLKGFYDKYKQVTAGKSWSDVKASNLIPEKLSWGAFFKTIIFTGKVPRRPEVAAFHSLIYYSFVILFIATDLVKIHADTPFKVFQGWTYIIVSFLSDIGGVAILFGLGMAYHRRYIKKPDYLSATNPKREKWMYQVILWLVLLGFVLEGIRLMHPESHAMPGEQFWSPVGFALSIVFAKLGVTADTWALIHKVTWMVHMINTMVFVASIPYTKFSHIFFLPISALLTPARRGAVLEPMNFEDENAETFGLGKLSELTLKNRLDLETCVECGRCTQVCPANNAGRNLNPKTIITKMRDFVHETQAAGKEDGDIFNMETGEGLYESNELDACTTCGACMEECPASIEHVNLIMEAKRFKTLTLGDIPGDAATAVQKVQVNGNPWGISQDERFKWADGLDVPVIEAGKKVDYLYYVGCAGSYDAANQKVVQDTVGLLKKAGVSFAVMGKTEKCNGDPIRRFGDEYTFYEIAIENIANMNQYDFGKVVTHCPHCLHTIGKEYAKFDDGDFDTVHHTELLAQLIKDGKIKPEKTVDSKLTFHDPCYLGRHHGEYNAPRSILESIPGVELTEMEKTKDAALCCGMGGGNMWYELPEGEEMAEKRLEHVAETSQQKLATACSYCLINFNSSKSEKTNTGELEVEDIASILAKSVD